MTSRWEVRRVARAGALGKLAAGKVARLAQAGCAGQLARRRQQRARPRLFAAPAGHVAVLPRHHLRGSADVGPGVEAWHAGVRHADGRADASSSADELRALLSALACTQAPCRGEIETLAEALARRTFSCANAPVSLFSGVLRRELRTHSSTCMSPPALRHHQGFSRHSVLLPLALPTPGSAFSALPKGPPMPPLGGDRGQPRRAAVDRAAGRGAAERRLRPGHPLGHPGRVE